MGRIRTVKPELFKHEDLYELEVETGLPVRLVFIGLFTCCDREGRFKWRPRALKLDIAPYDSFDMARVLHALSTRGFVRHYAWGTEEYGDIPTFSKHQVVNNRESPSEIPDFNECASESITSTCAPRVADACPTRLVQDQGEGKGKEGKGKEPASPRGKSKDLTLSQWVLSLPDDEEVIDSDDPIFEWAQKVGIPRDWVALAWFSFEGRYGDNGKRYRDWRAVFRKALREDWLRLWRRDPRTAGWVLTTAGEAAQMERQS